MLKTKHLILLIAILWPLDKYIVIHPINIILLCYVFNRVVINHDYLLNKNIFKYFLLVLVYAYSFMLAPDLPDIQHIKDSISITSTPPFDVIFSFIRAFFIIAYAIFIYDLIDNKSLKLFLKYFLIVTIVIGHLNIALYGIYCLAGINVFGAVRDVTLAAYPQLQSICIEPQALGNYIVMAMTVLLFNHDEMSLPTKTTLYYALILFVNIVLTLSSGAFLLLLLVFFLYAFSKNMKVVLAFISLTAIAIFMLHYNENTVINEVFNKVGLLFAGLTFLTNNLYFDTGQFFHSSAGARITFWQVALREFMANPLVGVGPERYGFFYEIYNYGRQGEVPNQPPQNIVFGTLANLGIIGIIVIFLLIFIPIIKSTFYFIRQNHLVDKGFKTTYILAICALFLQLQAWNFTSYKFWFFIIVLDKYLKNATKIGGKKIPCLPANDLSL